MQVSTLTKIAAVGSIASCLLTLYVLFGDHNWFRDRQPLQLDLAELGRLADGPAVLERFRELPLRCGVEQTALGAQVCWSEIGTFNGVPARHVAFYFDARQRLTAWKLSADADQYPALRDHFEQRYGKAAAADGDALTRPVDGGVLVLPAQAPAGQADVLWLAQPASS